MKILLILVSVGLVIALCVEVLMFSARHASKSRLRKARKVIDVKVDSDPLRPIRVFMNRDVD